MGIDIPIEMALITGSYMILLITCPQPQLHVVLSANWKNVLTHSNKMIEKVMQCVKQQHISVAIGSMLASGH